MKYWLTDLGETVSAVSVECPNGEKTHIGRYAIWATQGWRNRQEIIEVSDNLEDLATKYGINPEDVIPLRKVDANGQKS